MTVSTHGQNESPILIVGGGIAGLSLALVLGRHEMPCVIIEQRDEFSEIGAGLQLSPNAVRRLKELGLFNGLSVDATAPGFIHINDGLDGRPLTSVALGHTAEARYGVPYLVTARRDLQSLLLSALKGLPSVRFMMGSKFISYQQDAEGIVAELEGGETVEGALLVGADGVWSRVRQMLAPDAHPRTSGYIAWRALVPAADAPDILQSPDTQVWLGPLSHLVSYRVKGGDALNLVAVTPGAAKQKSWDEALPPELLYEELRPWHNPVRAAVMEIEGWQAWPLMVLRPFQPWHKRRLMVVGDAAHAVLPFLAQGAALCIEDALLLGRLLHDHRTELLKVPPLFEIERFARCRKVFSKSVMNGEIYHARSLWRLLRNLGLRAAPDSLLLKNYDWLYKY